MDMEIIKKLNAYYKKHQLAFKRISFFLKIAFSILLFYILLKKISLTTTIDYIINLPKITLSLLLGTTIIKFYLQMHNWKLLLQIDPTVSIPQSKVIKTHFIGLLLKLVIPGGQGTFGKAFYLKPLSKKSAFMIILLEKFFQSWIFFIAGALSAVFYFKNYSILFLLLFLISVPAPYLLPILFKKATTAQKWKRYKARLIYMYITQFVFLFITYYQYYLVLRLFYTVSFVTVMKTVALILGATLLPISYSGLGLRESVSVILFAKQNISPEIAVACSLTIFFFNSILPAIPALLFIFKKDKNL